MPIHTNSLLRTHDYPLGDQFDALIWKARQDISSKGKQNGTESSPLNPYLDCMMVCKKRTRCLWVRVLDWGVRG
jgi:hypothetical protein